MSKVIKDYQSGKVNVNQFKSELRDKNIQMDAEMDRLVRRQEAGDFVSQSDFGKKIYKNLNGSDIYNRPDKVNMNDQQMISPEKTGKNHFAVGQDVKQAHSRKVDNTHMDAQQRHLGAVYQETKGKSANQDKVEQTRSSIGGMLAGAQSAPQSDLGPQRNKNMKDRTSHDFIHWSNMNDEVAAKQGKKTVQTHKAAQNNGNFLQWGT